MDGVLAVIELEIVAVDGDVVVAGAACANRAPHASATPNIHAAAQVRVMGDLPSAAGPTLASKARADPVLPGL